MPRSQLTALQERVLVTLSGAHASWTLTGGGALAGMHLGHRTTRDLDLFFRGMAVLADAGRAAIARLRGAGLSVDVVQTSPAFEQLRVADADSVVIVDLVADPVSALEPPVEFLVGGVAIHVDTAYEILVNKLCALLGRAELRDLIDVRALLDQGFDLTRALADAPKKDSGFSPVTLAWVLKRQPLAAMLQAAELPSAQRAEAVAFRDEFVQRLMGAARPPR